jgi:hypothetical protein
MSLDNLNPKGQSEDAQTLADGLIRKLDEESKRKMEHVSAEDKNREQGAA